MARSGEKEAPASAARRPLITATARIWLGDDGVVHVEPLAQRKQELKDAIENVETVARVAAGVRRPLLVHFQAAAPQTPEARAHYTSPEAGRSICAVAIVTSSVLGRVIGNLMLGMNRTSLPLKLFDTEAAATVWLVEHRSPENRTRAS